MWQKMLRSLAWTPLLVLAGCGTKEDSSLPQGQPPFVLSASIQDLMVAEVDPAADFLWESVGTIVSAAGTDERRPRTDEEWKRVRSQAVVLTEAANLLMMEGRRVAAEGAKLEDEGVEGILTAVESQRAIDDARPAFVAFATALREVGAAEISAIDARDVDGMMKAGEELDAVCESCHLRFWYPDQVIPEFPRDFPAR